MKTVGTKRSVQCETIRIVSKFMMLKKIEQFLNESEIVVKKSNLFFASQDKHNLYDENLKPKTPGIVEVTREEFFKVSNTCIVTYRMMRSFSFFLFFFFSSFPSQSQRMFSMPKSSKKLNQNTMNSNNQAETKQNSSNRTAADPIEPSTSSGSKAGGGGGGPPLSDEKIQKKKRDIEALRHRIMRNVKKGTNNEKTEKDRLTLIKLEADLVKALKNG